MERTNNCFILFCYSSAIINLLQTNNVLFPLRGKPYRIRLQLIARFKLMISFPATSRVVFLVYIQPGHKFSVTLLDFHLKNVNQLAIGRPQHVSSLPHLQTQINFLFTSKFLFTIYDKYLTSNHNQEPNKINQ